MSRKGNCYDNAPMESFWGTLKNESLSHYRFNNRDEAISVIREYIEIFYNRQRRHTRLGNISPAAFREKYHQMTAQKRTNGSVRYCQYTSHTRQNGEVIFPVLCGDMAENTFQNPCTVVYGG
ncbi:insB domain protein [Shigella boydii 4444-74]|uniref:InsB domain protein n=1 Tax=Shigella boydii 4444-74 TaxID=766140 RepID=I6EMI6_SHIBO|nr:insB domain protein [Shigella boydii 4444-74]